MRNLWGEFAKDGRFPDSAVQYVRKEYYESPKAHQVMECHIFNCGNLHQTTTSRNEGAHAAFRSNRIVVPNLSNSYLRRREYNKLWIQRLRVKAAQACNRIPLDLQHVPELQDLLGKVSIFALTEIKMQIIKTKKEEAKGVTRATFVEGDGCNCHESCRYNLPCWHIVPTDGTMISLHTIKEFWLVKN